MKSHLKLVELVAKDHGFHDMDEEELEIAYDEIKYLVTHNHGYDKRIMINYLTNFYDEANQYFTVMEEIKEDMK